MSKKKTDIYTQRAEAIVKGRKESSGSTKTFTCKNESCAYPKCLCGTTSQC